MLVVKRKFCRNGHELTSDILYADGKQIRCRLCYRIRMNRHAKTQNGKSTNMCLHRKYRYENRYLEQTLARTFIRESIRIGKLVRFNFCSICGYEGNTQFHHFDYELDTSFKNIIEVCRKCHDILG